MSKSSIQNLPLPIQCSDFYLDGTRTTYALEVSTGDISAPTSALAVQSIQATTTITSGPITCNGLTSTNGVVSNVGRIFANAGLTATSITSTGAVQCQTTLNVTGQTVLGNILSAQGRVDCSSGLAVIGANPASSLILALATVPVAVDNAGAQGAGVAIGGLYRSGADPSVIYIRTA